MESQRKEVNLENPIFVLYMDVRGRKNFEREQMLACAKRNFDIYENITIWLIPSDRDEVCCVYDGINKIRNSELNRLIEEINEKIDIFSNSSSFSELKINIREWLLEKLVV